MQKIWNALTQFSLSEIATMKVLISSLFGSMRWPWALMVGIYISIVFSFPSRFISAYLVRVCLVVFMPIYISKVYKSILMAASQGRQRGRGPLNVSLDKPQVVRWWDFQRKNIYTLYISVARRTAISQWIPAFYPIHVICLSSFLFLVIPLGQDGSSQYKSDSDIWNLQQTVYSVVIDSRVLRK